MGINLYHISISSPFRFVIIVVLDISHSIKCRAIFTVVSYSMLALLNIFALMGLVAKSVL